MSRRVAPPSAHRLFTDLGEELAVRYLKLLGQPLDQVTRVMIELLLDRADEHRELLRAVLIEMPRRESQPRWQ